MAAEASGEAPDLVVRKRRSTIVGYPPQGGAELLGHSTIAITLDLHSHSVLALHRQAAQQFDQHFRASTSSTDVAQGAAVPSE